MLSPTRTIYSQSPKPKVNPDTDGAGSEPVTPASPSVSEASHVLSRLSEDSPALKKPRTTIDNIDVVKGRQVEYSTHLSCLSLQLFISFHLFFKPGYYHYQTKQKKDILGDGQTFNSLIYL